LQEEPIVLDTSSPVDITIKWRVTKDNPIYNEDERPRPFGEDAAKTYFKHPVRYFSLTDNNIFRTVMIDYIDPQATVKDVLDQIQGGSIEKIQLVGPIGNGTITNYATARVVFNMEIGAITTVNEARNHGMKILGQSVRVWAVVTQTYPKNEKLERDIFMNGYTRIVMVNDASQEAIDSLPIKLARLSSSIVTIGETFDKYPMIEFTNVADAITAVNLLLNDPEFEGAQFDFDEDYCGEQCVSAC
jgi:hypothetical protein